jgi:hypothetical protein
LKIAGKHRGHHSCGRETNEFFHELIAAGALAFWECVLSWKPELGYRLATHLRLRVSGAISDEAKRYRKRGITGETLLQRIAFGLGRKRNPLQKQKRYRSFREALSAYEVAIWEVDRWTQPYSCYSEGGEDDNRSLTGVLLENGGADDLGQKEPKPKRGMDRLYDCFNPYKQSPQLRLCGTNSRYISGAHSRHIDGLAEDADKRAARRLKQIGRRARALELVEEHDVRIEAVKKRDDAEWAAACASRGVVIDAAPIAHRRKYAGPRRHLTKIRSWRAPPKAAAA